MFSMTHGQQGARQAAEQGRQHLVQLCRGRDAATDLAAENPKGVE